MSPTGEVVINDRKIEPHAWRKMNVYFRGETIIACHLITQPYRSTCGINIGLEAVKACYGPFF